MLCREVAEIYHSCSVGPALGSRLDVTTWLASSVARVFLPPGSNLPVTGPTQFSPYVKVGGWRLLESARMIWSRPEYLYPSLPEQLANNL